MATFPPENQRGMGLQRSTASPDFGIAHFKEWITPAPDQSEANSYNFLLWFNPLFSNICGLFFFWIQWSEGIQNPECWDCVNLSLKYNCPTILIIIITKCFVSTTENIQIPIILIIDSSNGSSWRYQAVSIFSLHFCQATATTTTTMTLLLYCTSSQPTLRNLMKSSCHNATHLNNAI